MISVRRARFWTVATAVLLFGVMAVPAAVGGDPEIVVPKVVAPYRLVVASTPSEGTGYAWIVVGQNGALIATVDAKPSGTSKAAIVFVGPPGRYTVVLIVAEKSGVLVQSNASMVIGDNPDPEPDPGPDPGPDPEPEPGKRFVLVISESAEISLEKARVLTALEKYAKAKGHDKNFLDKDYVDKDGKVPAWFRLYRQRIDDAKVSLPALVIIDETAVAPRWWVHPLPSKADEAIELIQKHGG